MLEGVQGAQSSAGEVVRGVPGAEGASGGGLRSRSRIPPGQSRTPSGLARSLQGWRRIPRWGVPEAGKGEEVSAVGRRAAWNGVSGAASACRVPGRGAAILSEARRAAGRPDAGNAAGSRAIRRVEAGSEGTLAGSFGVRGWRGVRESRRLGGLARFWVAPRGDCQGVAALPAAGSVGGDRVLGAKGWRLPRRCQSARAGRGRGRRRGEARSAERAEAHSRRDHLGGWVRCRDLWRWSRDRVFAVHSVRQVRAKGGDRSLLHAALPGPCARSADGSARDDHGTGENDRSATHGGADSRGQCILLLGMDEGTRLKIRTAIEALAGSSPG